MTVKMCIKYSQQLREDGIGFIKRRETMNQRQVVFKKSQSPKSMMIRRGVTQQKHPYLNINSDLTSRIRKAVNELTAKEKCIEATSNLGNGNACQTVIKTEPGSGIDAFIAIMVHSSKCKECPQLSCRKMRIVLHHYIRCGRLVAGESCQVCQQLLSIVTQHATTMCNIAHDQACPVPLCDDLRRSGLAGLDFVRHQKTREI